MVRNVPLLAGKTNSNRREIRMILTHGQPNLFHGSPLFDGSPRGDAIDR